MTVAIVQTGRLGDLWYTVPLADRLHRDGETVEVWYDRAYGDPFHYFPSVVARPMPVPNGPTFPLSRPSIAGAQQVALCVRALRERRRIVWNQIYPFRLDAYAKNRPYPEYWYRRYPNIDFRRATTTLRRSNDGTLLYFATSLSLRVGLDSPFTTWLERNLERLHRHTGYRIVYVPPPGESDHPRYETWRGDLDAYQRLIAGCGIVFGMNTSAHVLGQLLGKPIVTCYARRNRRIDTIGAETAALFPGDDLDAPALARLDAVCATTKPAP